MSGPNQALRKAAEQVPDLLCLMVLVGGTAQMVILRPPQLGAILDHSDYLGLSLTWQRINMPSGPGLMIYGDGLEALCTVHKETP